MRVDLRTVELDVPPQDVITRDNVPVKVMPSPSSASSTPSSAVARSSDVLRRPSQIAATTLARVLGKADLDALSPSAAFNGELRHDHRRAAEP